MSERYELRSGKFGFYFHDTIAKEDLGLKDVRNRLNALNVNRPMYKYTLFQCDDCEEDDPCYILAPMEDGVVIDDPRNCPWHSRTNAKWEEVEG